MNGLIYIGVNENYITRSNELLKSQLMETVFADYEHIKIPQETTHSLWEHSCRTFIQISG